MSNEIISLDQKAVQREIEKQITAVTTNKYSMTHDRALLHTIENIDDSTVKGELLDKYLEALKEHQGEKNVALRNEIASQIKINEQYAMHEIEKDRARAVLFNNRYLVVFLWVFPVLLGFATVAILDSYAFATLIMFLLYGVLIALYFSQSSGLAETWKALIGRRREL
ncbi:hypothetical protein [Vibrio navarrensis]|uniref:hypothetical protein n=1 Tax=Vibrio navarrensis TaxID=29495 RepID=UPI0015595522|nr:hypothetical protein [Vibrio navarrensis]